MEETRLDKIKKIIEQNYEYYDCGIYFIRGDNDDHMETIEVVDGVTITGCYNWGYYEIFGLTEEEQDELMDFYRACKEQREEREETNK